MRAERWLKVALITSDDQLAHPSPFSHRLERVHSSARRPFEKGADITQYNVRTTESRLAHTHTYIAGGGIVQGSVAVRDEQDSIICFIISSRQGIIGVSHPRRLATASCSIRFTAAALSTTVFGSPATAMSSAISAATAGGRTPSFLSFLKTLSFIVGLSLGLGSVFAAVWSVSHPLVFKAASVISLTLVRL